MLLSLGFLNGYEKNRIIVISQHFAVSKLPNLNELSSFKQSIIKNTFFLAIFVLWSNEIGHGTFKQALWYFFGSEARSFLLFFYKTRLFADF